MLERIYAPLVHHAVMSYGAEQVMRYMGRPGGEWGSTMRW